MPDVFGSDSLLFYAYDYLSWWGGHHIYIFFVVVIFWICLYEVETLYEGVSEPSNREIYKLYTWLVQGVRGGDYKKSLCS